MSSGSNRTGYATGQVVGADPAAGHSCEHPWVAWRPAAWLVLFVSLGAADAAGAAAWVAQPVPVLSANMGGLAAVACPSGGVCTAVGQTIGRLNHPTALAERWDETRWAIQSTPNPVGGTDSGLSSVSCPSSTACVAVGYSYKAGSQVTLAERWNGRRWSIQGTPNPGAVAGNGKTAAELDGVSCSSSTSCIAVGFYLRSDSTAGTLAERWNGRSWTLQTGLGPSAGGSLVGVSCTSSIACMAVGYSSEGGSQATLAERWDGTRWSTQPTPHAPDARLTAVSCSSSRACTAVGYFGRRLVKLAERWDGRRWSVQSALSALSESPGQTGTSSILQSVSCPSSRTCVAVGAYNRSANPAAQAPLVERWNGMRWSSQTTSSTATATRSVLFGVACASSAACTAVGSYSDAAGRTLPLALRSTARLSPLVPPFTA